MKLFDQIALTLQPTLLSKNPNSIFKRKIGQSSIKRLKMPRKFEFKPIDGLQDISKSKLAKAKKKESWFVTIRK